MSQTPDTRLAALGIELPSPAAPVANYVAAVHENGMLTISGQLPLEGGKLALTGRLGDGVDIEAAVAAAKLCMVNVIAQARAALDGDLGRIRRVVRLGGFIAASADFTQHATVMNGASDLAVAVFGDAGRHARSTIGVASLPLGAPVEGEALFAVD